MTGTVVSGTNNKFAVACGDEIYLCGIKGKVLKESVGYYNALAPGDVVEFVGDAPGTGRIVALAERKNAFARLNSHNGRPQVMAANIDWLGCVTSPDRPPFRPRFIDRVLVTCEKSGVRAIIICNKRDLGFSPDVGERLADYERIGYAVAYVSARTGEGIDGLSALLCGGVTALVGQSGVGKTSLLNRLCPGKSFRVSGLSEKYGKGAHTTTMFRLERVGGDGMGFALIDTPGIRSFCLSEIGKDDLVSLMPEFRALAHLCSYSNCTHTQEPGCKILEAVYAGYIHEDRYESFIRMREEI